MRGYLLDTNHIEALFDKHPKLIHRFEQTPPEHSLFWISAISLGEIEASYLITERDPEVVRRHRKFIRETFLSGPKENTFVFGIDERSYECYARVIHLLRSKYPPSSPKQRTEMHLAQLGVDINDVWIFSTAWERSLTLLTTDKMAKIRSVVPNDVVAVENWL